MENKDFKNMSQKDFLKGQINVALAEIRKQIIYFIIGKC